MRETLLKEKAGKVQAELERWAKKCKILRPGERIVFSFHIDIQPIVVQQEVVSGSDMSIEDFFNEEYLMNLGMSASSAAKARRAVLNSCINWNNDYPEEEKIKTVGDFLRRYQYHSYWLQRLYKRRGYEMGRQTASSLASALRTAGFRIR